MEIRLFIMPIKKLRKNSEIIRIPSLAQVKNLMVLEGSPIQLFKWMRSTINELLGKHNIVETA